MASDASDAPAAAGNGSGATASPWMEGGRFPQGPGLAEDLHCELLVVGAGIAGLTAAYHAAKNGLDVVVLDDGPVGMGETLRTTAHLVSAVDDRIHQLESWHGKRRAHLAVQAHAQAIDLIGDTVRREAIDCGYTRRDGYLFLKHGDKPRELRKEAAAATRAGLDVELVDEVPWGRIEGPALRFADQGQFHPRAYLDGLATALREAGGRIHTGVHVDEVKEAKGAVVARATGGAKVDAHKAVLATNVPVGTKNLFFAKVAAYRTYVVAAPIARAKAPEALLWSTGHPYYYVRTQPDPRDRRRMLLIVGGEDHRVGQSGDPIEHLDNVAAWMAQHFPGVGPTAYRWSGQVQETMDGLCFAGRMPGHRRTFVVAGDSGMGMTHGTLGGKLVADLAAGLENPWAEVFDPARVRVKAMSAHVLTEDLKSSAPYVRRLAAAEVKSVDDVPLGEGRVLREGGRPVCVHRALDGTVTRRSAVCVHLGCIVGWNALEGSWDCPCHGSRYDAQGQVLMGPANAPLASAEGGATVQREVRKVRRTRMRRAA